MLFYSVSLKIEKNIKKITQKELDKKQEMKSFVTYFYAITILMIFFFKLKTENGEVTPCDTHENHNCKK